jgi:hypothetical protein
MLLQHMQQNSKRPISISPDITTGNTQFASCYRTIYHSFPSDRSVALWRFEQKSSGSLGNISQFSAESSSDRRTDFLREILMRTVQHV